jgi:putative ABC transport system permease protein
VANLLLSRGAQRKHELAVRAALGAGRARLVRLLLAESLMLAAGGGLLGILLARWSLRALATLYPPELPRVAEIAMNAPVLLFTLLVSLAAAGVAGLLPALRVSRADLGLRPRASRTGKLRAALTIAQVALAMVLLTCAGLLVRSFLIRTHVSGFNPDRVVVAELSFSSRLSPGRLDEILARLRTLPGVTAATAATSFSYSRMMTLPVEAVGQPAAGAPLQPSLQAVTPQYFQVLDLPVLQGRALVETDRASSPLVAVISANMAERAFGDVPPLGRKIRFFRQEWTVVGVAADVPKFGADPDPVVYVPAAQEPDLEARTLGVRTAGPPQNAFPAVRSIIRAMEPRLPILHLQTMREDMAEMVASQRFYTLLLGVFAAFALGLAVMGVYGVVSFMVSLRTHEIGVRMALGASSVHVLRSVLREGAVLALAGIVLGTAASIAAARLLLSTTLLYKVKPSDPLTFAVVPAVLLLAALAASGLPARRAARVDPVVALKWE